MDEMPINAIPSAAMTKINLGCALLAGALMAAGCGEDTACLSPMGAFEVETAQVAGDCGDLGTIVIEVGDGAPAGCLRTETESASGCYVERQQTCDDGVEESSGVLEMHISEDGESISGDIGLAIRDSASGSLICASEYRFSGMLLAP